MIKCYELWMLSAMVLCHECMSWSMKCQVLWFMLWSLGACLRLRYAKINWVKHDDACSLINKRKIKLWWQAIACVVPTRVRSGWAMARVSP